MMRMLLDPTRMSREAESLHVRLQKRIVGQDDALRQIVDVYQTFLSGMAGTRRPVGSFLMLGPTGTGKTRTVEALAESLFGEARAVIKIDCAEFQHSHEIAKLIGSPPGYLGHRETHPLLTQESLNQFHTEEVKLSLVLFDEIEKASDSLWNLLLGILDKATLTLGDNRQVDFSRAMIFLTSNLGAREIDALVRPNLGFAAGLANDSSHVDTSRAGKIAHAGVGAARRIFSPEFLNRIDKTIVFAPLGEPELRRILALELEAVQDRIHRAVGVSSVGFRASRAAEDFLLCEGIDSRYGARHLKRAVERLLVAPFANLIATGQVGSGDSLLVDFDQSTARLMFLKETKDTACGTVSPVPPQAMAA
ncbi:MAG: ATP-dependent Clp protease ATP-binding subunit [Terriglobia bacterium]|nr:MAG: ATP-dependent Clp protease ATP-binding subunit [Terriglobia bacterium]